MKKGFISMTIVYSFLLVFIFTLLAFLVLYTQKSRLVDSIVNEAKEQLYTGLEAGEPGEGGQSSNPTSSRINTALNNKRYIKDCIKGNTANLDNHWVEIKVMKDGTNIALNKPVSGTNPAANNTTLSYSNVVDGNIQNVTGNSGYGYSGVSGTTECVTIDLQGTYDLDEIIVWHYYADGRTYYNNVTYVSEDADSWIAVINEASPETVNGKKVSAYVDVLNGYIQNGLLAWYDGISNTGLARSTTTTTWKDLSGNSKNGTITSGTWGTNYLSLGSSSKVSTGINLVNTFTPTNDTTYEIVAKINSWPNTNTQYGNTGVIFGVANYGGYGIIWSRATNESNALIFGHKRTEPNDLSANVYRSEKFSAPTDALSISYVDNYNTEGKLFWFIDGQKLNSTASIGGTSYDVFSSDNIIGVNNVSVYGGNYVGAGLSMYVYSVRLYNRALSEEEVYHNYLFDKERFGL